jgi:CheY-like chemotaxis protein
VVEDHPDVRRVTAARLRVLGYEPVEAEGAREAVAFLESGERVDLVFSDVVMPGGLSGHELARLVRKRWPTIPVLLTSGYAPQTADDDGGDWELLAKPYQQEALAAALEKALAIGTQSRDTSAANT